MDYLLKVRDLSKRFTSGGIAGFGGGHSTDALVKINFKLKKGQIFGLVGESGCGKTTLARCLLLLERPDSGSIEFMGRNLCALKKKELREIRRSMQIVFQDPNSSLNPKLKVRFSLEEGLSNIGMGKKERRARVEETAELVGIPAGHLDRYPHEFSGGQKQRLVIARALTLRPGFLILDEPVSSLDVSIQAQILNLLQRLKDELDLTYLFISHDLNLVAYFSDFIGVMKEGRIIEHGTPEALLNEPAREYTRELFRSAPHLREKE